MTIMKRFTNKEDFYEHFKKMAEEHDEELTDDFCVEGNSDFLFGRLRFIAESIGYNNVLVNDDYDYVSDVEFDVSKKRDVIIDLNASDAYYSNGIIHLWFD